MRTLYRASRVYTLAHPQTGEWILVDERHVQRVGSGEPPTADRVVELPGSVILPGFIDAHVHLTGAGAAADDAEAERVGSAEQLVDLARRLCTGAGSLTHVRGFDESRWESPILPTLAELDEACGGWLVIGRVDGHVSLANSAALEAADVLALPGVERDARGEPTGRVTLDANHRLQRWAAMSSDEDEIRQLQMRGASLAAARGITCVHEMAMPLEHGLRELEVMLGQRAMLPVDVVPVISTMDIPQVMDLRLPAIGGDLPIDGSIGARTAALSSPYNDGPGLGSLAYTDDELAGFLRDGHLAGLQVGIHVIGDRAIEQVLAAWDRVYSAMDSRGRRHLRARRHRLEHFEMATPEQVERAAMLGLAASVQPAFDAAWGGPGGLYEVALGAERAGSMNAFRTMIDRGLEVGAGSDAPVTPLDPMIGIDAFERHHAADQRLSRLEAMRTWMIGGARLAHLEEKKGALEPGAHADFAVYDADPMTIDSVLGLRPVLTVSLGREVFSA